MKNIKKIIGIILTICMVLQILPVFATGTDVQIPATGGSAGGSGINYLINDNFSALTEEDMTTGLDGWSLVTDTDFTDYPVDIVTTEEIPGDEGNYALKYTVTADTWDPTHIEKAVARADGSAVTFTTGTDVVIEARMAQSTGNMYTEDGTLIPGTGRSYLKYNLPADVGTDEWNLNFGTLVRVDNNTDGSAAVSGFAGWDTPRTGTNSNGEEVSYYYASSNSVELATVTANEYFNVKIVIHGQTGGEGNTADYYILDDDGNIIKESKGNNIDHPGECVWGLSADNVHDPDPATWVEDVLNTIDFRMRNANTLYVDYIRAYEVTQSEVCANLTGGRYVQYDEKVEIKLTTEADMLTLIESTAALTTAEGTDVTASVSYNNETNVLTVDPTENLTPGKIYYLTFADNEFTTFTGTKTFELEAREARLAGVVVNDTFDDLQLGTTDNASGWYLGAVADDAAKGTLEIVDESTDENAAGATGKALKVEGAITGADGGNALQTYVTKKIGGGIDYTDNNTVVIKTRIKHTNQASRLHLLENRPDSLNLPTNALGYNLYNLIIAYENKSLCGYNLNQTNDSATQQGSSEYLNADIVTAGKWMDIELSIKNNGKKMDATAIVENGDGTTSTYSLTDLNLNRTKSVYEYEYGIGTDVRAFDALERLGFTFRKSDDVLYIDEFKVCEVYGDVAVLVDETYMPGESIEVKFDVNNGDYSFLDAVKLYSGETEITEISKSINDTNNIVTIDAGTLAEGAYSIVIDTTNVPTYAYNIDDTAKTFYVVDKEYLIYDEFGDENYEGWTLDEDSGYELDAEEAKATYLTTSRIGETDNYALKYTADGTNWRYTHISKLLNTPEVFEDGKNIVIEAKLKQTNSGRAYLKYNLLTDPNDTNEWNFNWGTLVVNDTGWIGVTNGWPSPKTGTDKNGNTVNYYINSDIKWTSKAVVLANDWYTVKVTIHGTTGGTANKATYIATYNDGQKDVVFEHKNLNIDFPDNAIWGSATGSQGPDWVEDVLNSVDFRMRNAETLEIDYVKVYEYTSTDVRVNTVEGKTFEAGTPIEFKVTAADGAKVSKEIEETVTVTKDGETVNATVAYENGILKVTAEAATEGDIFTVTFTDNDYIKYVDSTTEFTVTARGAYDTGVIINDTFDSEDASTTFDGWCEGASNIKTDLEIDTTKFPGMSVLKISTTGEVNDTTLGNQVVAYRKLGNGVELNENKQIIIKTKVYQEAANPASTGRFDLRFNRPDAVAQVAPNDHQWLQYGIFRQQNNWASVVSSTGHSTLGLNYVNSTTISNLTPANKWVEYTIAIDGETKTMKVTAVADGQTYTASGIMEYVPVVYEDLYGKGATATEYDVEALESLTFKNTTAEPVYIDYISVYEADSAVSVAIDTVKMAGNADIGAYIYTGSTALENLDGYVELYDETGAVVPSTKTQIDGTQKVVIDPTSDLEIGTYTVKFNVAALATKGYIIEGDTAFAFEVIEGADLTEDFESFEVDADHDANDDTWAFDPDNGVSKTATVIDENGNKFLRINVNGDVELGEDKQVTYSKTLDTPFVRDMKASTVFEMKIRTNSDDLRKLVKFNYPNEGSLGTNAYKEYGWNTRNVAALNKGSLSVAYDDYSDDSNPEVHKQGKGTDVAAYELNQWYTLKTIYHNAEGTASSYVYDESGALVGKVEDKALTAWWYSFYDYNKTQPQVMHIIDDITIRFRPNTGISSVTDEQFDVDDIKLYNVADIVEVAESATAKFMSGETEVKAITEDGSVVPTFEIQSKNNQKTEYYIIAAKYENGKLVGTPQMKEVEITGKQTVTLDAIEVDKDNTGLVVKAFVWNKNMAPVCNAAEIKPTVYTIYMATYGSDANEGYESTPVATLNRAIELANDAQTKGYATSEIVIADGNYELTGNTISIGSNLKADSLTVRAENKGEAKFINGISFKISEAVKADTTAQARLTNEAAREHLYVIDLGAKLGGIEKIPAVNLPGTYSYTADGLAMASGTFEIEETRVAPGEMFFNGSPMTVARYPDGEYANLGTVSIDGKDSEGNVIDADCNYTSVSVTRGWMKDKNIVEVADRKADPFTVKLAQAVNWSQADQAIAFGYWMHDWATQSTPVTFANGVMTSKYPSHYGLKEGQRYYVFNLLEEISQPGEYFIDRKTGLMYFYMPTGATQNDEIIMSLHSGNIFDITASNVTINGLVITASRGKAIRVAGDNIKIQNCEISDTADTAVSISGTNSEITDCYIHDVDGGISLGGGSTSNLTEGNNKALRNKITNFSRIDKTYTDAIYVSGVGNTASYNTIWNGEHLAIRISGVGNEISYNNISQVLKETDDAGAIYAGRSWVSRDNVIKNNYFHDIGTIIDTAASGKNPVAGIFLDDHFAGVEITGNIFENIGGHGVRTNMGREITISNNIFEGCTNGGFSVKKSINDEVYYTESGHIGDVEDIIAGTDGYDFAKWLKKYPELFTQSGDAYTYNQDLIKTQDMVLINNYISGSSSGYSTGDGSVAITFGEDGNVNEDNVYASASKMLNGDYSAAKQTSIVQKVHINSNNTFDLSDFLIINFEAIADNPVE